MRIELVGPQAAGKSTIAEAIASHLGLPKVQGQGFHAVDGRPLTDDEIRWGRWRSVVRDFPMFVSVAVYYRGVPGSRLRFAINTCRRNEVARQLSHGVLESGPVHGLVQGSVNWGTDASHVARRLVPAQLYVRLRAPAEVLVDRLVEREQDETLRASQVEWIQAYERLLDSVLVGRPVVEVDVDCGLDMAVDRTLEAIRGAEGGRIWASIREQAPDTLESVRPPRATPN